MEIFIMNFLKREIGASESKLPRDCLGMRYVRQPHHGASAAMGTEPYGGQPLYAVRPELMNRYFLNTLCKTPQMFFTSEVLARYPVASA